MKPETLEAIQQKAIDLFPVYPIGNIRWESHVDFVRNLYINMATKLEQEREKSEKLVEALKSYTAFIEKGYSEAASFCFAHGINPSETDIEKGKELRAKIESLK